MAYKNINKQLDYIKDSFEKGFSYRDIELMFFEEFNKKISEQDVKNIIDNLSKDDKLNIPENDAKLEIGQIYMFKYDKNIYFEMKNDPLWSFVGIVLTLTGKKHNLYLVETRNFITTIPKRDIFGKKVDCKLLESKEA